MKFYCLCLSPALDALVALPQPPRGEGEIFKNVVDEENAGGKAINVARWLAIRGADVLCGGLLGEDNAAPFVKEFARYGIGDRFVRVAGSTRRNEMVAWPGGSFKVNRAAFPEVRPEDFPGLGVLKGLDELAPGDTVVISGSLPQNFPASFYADCIVALKARGLVTVLDASGAALVEGVKAHPDLIKPNAEECAPLVGFVPKTPEEFRRATDLLRADCAHVIISDGGAGAWFDGVFRPAPAVKVVDTTAAGDTLLAEWCWSHDPRLALAAGSAACTMAGSRPPSVAAVEKLAEGQVG